MKHAILGLAVLGMGLATSGDAQAFGRKSRGGCGGGHAVTHSGGCGGGHAVVAHSGCGQQVAASSISISTAQAECNSCNQTAILSGNIQPWQTASWGQGQIIQGSAFYSQPIQGQIIQSQPMMMPQYQQQQMPQSIQGPSNPGTGSIKAIPGTLYMIDQNGQWKECPQDFYDKLNMPKPKQQ